MEDSWVCIEDSDDTSSNYSFSDSDKIDSETEAALYSTIHYEEKLPAVNSHNYKNVEAKPSALFVCSPYKINDVLCTDEKKEDVHTHIELVNKNLILNNASNENDYLETKKSPDARKVDHNLLTPTYLSPSRKRKSDSEGKVSSTESINFSESSKNKLSNIQNKKTKFSLHAKQNSSKKAEAFDSSDSDNNLMWEEEDCSRKSDLKINLFDETEVINLSSDSDNELDLSFSPIKKYSILKNLSMPNIKLGEISKEKDLWHINNEDLLRQKKYSHRYHDNIHLTCSNCNKRGHTYRLCSEPKTIKCFICGGEHLGTNCVNRICSNCHKPGHARKRCRQKTNIFVCHLCNMRGHIVENCPDLWRRYHLTTKPGNINKGKRLHQDTNLYCWNCGMSHFGSVCSSRNTVTTWPCVVNYSNPAALLKRRLNKSAHFVRNGHVNKNKGIGVSVNLSEGNKDVYFKSRNESTVEKIAENTNGNRKKQRTNMQFKRFEKIGRQKNFPRTPKKNSPLKAFTGLKDNMPESVEIVRQKDFPRTPKKNSPLKAFTGLKDNMPESVELVIQRQLRNKRKNHNRKIKRRQKKLQDESLQNSN